MTSLQRHIHRSQARMKFQVKFDTLLSTSLVPAREQELKKNLLG